METLNIKVESGIQLLARLQRKPVLENFYPILFDDGPKPNDVIEIFSDVSSSSLLMDIITQALIPAQLGGIETGVLIYNTDGHIHFDHLIAMLRKKVLSCASAQAREFTEEELNNLIHTSLSNLSILEIYDAAQFYTSLYSLEKILVETANISLIIFDTLTAFYWSEQDFKIIKMDIYLKNLLTMIQRITKEYKITILYTRPEYFTSSKNSIENLEKCSVLPTFDHINYRIQLLCNNNESYEVNIKTFSKFNKRSFKVIQDLITWL